jgi:hypothetical protein
MNFKFLIFQDRSKHKKVISNQIFYFYYNRSQEYSEYTLQQAIDLQKTMDNDMGGTEILEPMKSIYSNSCKQGYPRQVLLLFCAFVGIIYEYKVLWQNHQAMSPFFTGKYM